MITCMFMMVHLLILNKLTEVLLLVQIVQGLFTSSTGAVTFRFYSDGATVNPGFIANYQCSYDQPVSIHSVKNDVLLYPNPAKNHLNISLTDNFQAYRLKVVDIYGKVLIDKNLIPLTND